LLPVASAFFIQLEHSVRGSAGSCEGVEDNTPWRAPDLNHFLEKPKWLDGIEAMTAANHSTQFVDARLAVTGLRVFPRCRANLEWLVVVVFGPIGGGDDPLLHPSQILLHSKRTLALVTPMGDRPAAGCPYELGLLARFSQDRMFGIEIWLVRKGSTFNHKGLCFAIAQIAFDIL
jgi:hypothetical protein